MTTPHSFIPGLRRRSRAGVLIAFMVLPIVPRVLAAQVGSTVAAADTARLGGAIRAVLDTGELARAHWGVAVHDVATGMRLYGRNADRLFVPASALKLVVSATAAHHLKPEYRYTTTFLATGPVTGGTLRGDLVVYGRGDPTISARYHSGMTTVFNAVADSLAARGIRRITGSVVADVAHWPEEAQHGDWERYDLNWWYAAATGPLGFNDNAIDFRVTPGAVGSPASITWQPQSRAFTFVNRTRTVPADSAHTLDFDRLAGTDSIFAYGNIPLNTAARTESFAVRDPAHYAATVLTETLIARGIAVNGARAHVGRGAAAGATTLFALKSVPLPQVIGPILQSSQNWFAEQLAKTVGHEVSGAGTWSAGLAVESRFLTDLVRIERSAFRLRDASGLSGGNLITPNALAQLVAYIARDASQSVVREALPVSAAATGSLRRRFEDMPGRVRAKTGSIRNVDSLAGVVRADSGREVAFVIIANGTGLPGSRIRTAEDDVVRLIARAY